MSEERIRLPYSFYADAKPDEVPSAVERERELTKEEYQRGNNVSIINVSVTEGLNQNLDPKGVVRKYCGNSGFEGIINSTPDTATGILAVNMEEEAGWRITKYTFPLR